MTTRSAIPATIGTLPRHTALAFLSLFFVPGVAQAILLTVVPLEASQLLSSARAVTLLYVGTGLCMRPAGLLSWLVFYASMRFMPLTVAMSLRSERRSTHRALSLAE